jgi:hypothetical protein
MVIKAVFKSACKLKWDTLQVHNSFTILALTIPTLTSVLTEQNNSLQNWTHNSHSLLAFRENLKLPTT